jgi:hypothetical protein
VRRIVSDDGREVIRDEPFEARSVAARGDARGALRVRVTYRRNRDECDQRRRGT